MNGSHDAKGLQLARRGMVTLAGLLAGGTLVGGCTYTAPAEREARVIREENEAAYRAAFPIRDAERPITVDGEIGEWPEGVYALADEHWVYLRFEVEPRDEEPALQALQASSETLELRLDLDGNVLTGVRESNGELGIDLVIELSPPQGDGVGNGARITRYDTRGNGRTINHEAAGFSFAPTFASDWYEARIARSALSRAIAAGATSITDPARSALGAGGGIGGATYTLRDASGELAGQSGVVRFELPPLSAEDDRDGFAIPRPRGDATRFVAYNILRGGPVETPAPFARVLRALAPDVVMVQEWDDATPAELSAWFERHVGGEWEAATGAGRGVGIATRFPILWTHSEAVMADGGRYPVRLALALVQTPVRSTLVGSVHLKCCGSAGSSEDVLRIAEARAITEAISGLNIPGEYEIVIGGDLNLVGTRTPLDVLGDGLDSDGSGLDAAEALVLADAAVYTWRDAGSSFTPGRLDWIVYSGASSRAVNAFVLDDDRLADQSLERAGLERGDTSASDHRPVVLDLKMLDRE